MTSGWIALLLVVTSVRGFASPACAECHSAIYQKQRISHHGQTLRRFEGSPMALALGPGLTDEGGRFRFEYRGASVKVSKNAERADARLDWAFGAGSQGYTAVGEFQGKYFEHRISWFVLPARPGLTPGQPVEAPHSAAGALGSFKTPEEAFRCFRCHSTDLRRDKGAGPDLSVVNPGLTCERCHGPGDAHLASVRGRGSPQEIRKAIFSAAHLPAKASIEVCGECHRTQADLRDPVTVRFQPVGLMASACFRGSSTLSCASCHDPHDDAVRKNGDYYDTKCVDCHTSRCKTGEKGQCLGCHMKRVSLTPYLTFTDHRIRVYR